MNKKYIHILTQMFMRFMPVLMCYADDWNIGEKSGRWQVQRVLEKLQFTYGVDAFFTVNIVEDELAENTSRPIIQVGN